METARKARDDLCDDVKKRADAAVSAIDDQLREKLKILVERKDTLSQQTQVRGEEGFQ